MITRHTENEGALERLLADMAQWDAEAAKRDKNDLRWQVGLQIGFWIAMIVVLGIWP